MRKLIFGLLAFLGSAVLFVALISGAWILKDRLSSPPPHNDTSLYQESAIPELPYEHVPGASGVVVGIPVTLNSFGFRGPEVSLQKPGSVTRIALLGDSSVFGQGVEDDQTLSAVLEGMITDTASSYDHRYQVINAGVRGYNTLQEAAFLRARVMPLDPDGVVLCITEINDAELEPFRYASPRLEQARKSFWWKVAPVRVVMAWRLQQDYLEASREHIRSLFDPAGRPWKKFIQALKDIRDQCEENDSWLLCVTIPLIEDENTFEKERAELHAKLEELGIDYIDAKPAFSRYPWRDLVISPKDMHPNALAQRILAGLIFEELKSKGRTGSAGQ
jgi:lysophospholipase L1-like esterase